MWSATVSLFDSGSAQITLNWWKFTLIVVMLNVIRCFTVSPTNICTDGTAEVANIIIC